MIPALAFLLAADEPPIVITGRGLDRDGEVIAITTVEGEDARRSASGRIEEVIERHPGLTGFRRSDGRSSHPTSEGLTMRGLGGNAAARVALVVDGVPQADPFGGWINLSAFPLSAVERIRFVRGGGAGADHGSGALAGAILIDTLDSPALEASLFHGNRDSWDGSARLGTDIGESRIVVAGSWQSGDGFTPIVAGDRGRADRPAPFSQKNGRLRLIAAVGTASLQANLSAFDDERDRGFDGSDNRARGVDASLRYVTNRFSVGAYWQDRSFKTRFAALDEQRDTSRVVLDQYRVPATGLGLTTAIRGGNGALRWQAGASLRHVEGEARERYFFVGGEPTRERRSGGKSLTVGASVALDWSEGPLTIEAGARLDHWRHGQGFRFERALAGGVLTDERFAERSGWQPSGMVGIAYKLDDGFTLRAAATRSWRLPTLNELYRPFRVGADTTAANASLDPEVAHGVEAGFDWKRGPFTVSVSAFAMRLDNAVANVPLATGPGVFPGVGFVSATATYAQRRNLRAIRSRGIEFDSSWESGPWTVALGWTYSDARVRASGAAASLDGARPAQVPMHEASASLGWQDGGRSAALLLSYTGSRFEDLENQIRLKGALSVDALAELPLGSGIALSLRGENLLDSVALARIDSAGVRERARPRTLWIGMTFRRSP